MFKFLQGKKKKKQTKTTKKNGEVYLNHGVFRFALFTLLLGYSSFCIMQIR